MSSFASALSTAFGVTAGHGTARRAVLEIDRFDSWSLASTAGHMPLVTCGKGNEEDDEAEKA